MSGGHFGYAQYKIDQIADQISEVIRRNDESPFPYRPEVVQRLIEAVNALEVAFVYAQRVDFLICGDDNEENFERRLLEDLADVDEDLRK
jgi:hypothetical protein